MNRHHTPHEQRHTILANRFKRLDNTPPAFEPVKLEWNRDASSILVIVTIGLFITAAALFLHLFVDLNSGGLQ